MKAIISLVVLLVILSVPLSVYAHAGEAHIELSVTQAQPGMTIEVHGSGFEPGDATTIMLMLVSTDRPQVLGSATADANGDLAQVVGLPKDVIDGAYEVRVVDTHHVATATLSIVTNLTGDEEGSQRAEEEPLLAPMPESLPITSASPSPTTSPSAAATPTMPPTLLFLSGLALVVLVVSLVVVSRRSQ